MPASSDFLKGAHDSRSFKIHYSVDKQNVAIHPVENYPAIKRTGTCYITNEPGNPTLSERSQAQKDM